MNISRRSIMLGASALALTPLLTRGSSVETKRSFRFIHITDLHIQPELDAAEGVQLCVSKIMDVQPRPDFVIIGGDHVMDLLEVTQERASLQFRLLKEKLKPLNMPIYHVVGNHDVYGWSDKSSATVTDPGYGKAMFEEKFTESKSYFSFDHHGWHFVMLDSIVPSGRSWVGRIDDVQLQWLKDDLKSVGGRPIIITTHMPILTAFVQYDKGTTYPSPNKLITENGKEVVDLFHGHNVKLVLQGHTHVLEEIDYAGTTYLTAGSVCGDWWKGPRLGIHPEGFTIVDVNADSVATRYVPYGWHARVQRIVPLAI